ncbi:MAG: hypothetical protein NTX76_06460 [Alphaproteobacteria bacterium]|nr:hypothetical protein [Alphaproteobacteria bacterium]
MSFDVSSVKAPPQLMRTLDQKEPLKKADTHGLTKFLGEDADKQIEFTMRLLLAQMENQIPGNETDTTEMVRSIMGIVTTAQQGKMVSLAEEGNRVNSALYSLTTTNLEGDIVEHEGDLFTIDEAINDGTQDINVSLPENVAQATLVIADGDGNLVRALPVPTSAGKHKQTWDGTNESGAKVTGNYVVSLVAVNGSGAPIGGKVTLNSVITSVAYDDENLPVLMAGDIEIRNFERHQRPRLPQGAYPNPRPIGNVGINL